ncbi:condensation domain-containing protein, partial [Paenibacillus sp. 598K]|uniref:condensation domain-containing protein n=1 Tax=Paenibacillus sp. 598K TaxID=1117987 RepID=UPI0021A9B314
MNRDIAIIGMAARFPEAPGIEQVPELFKRSPDLVRELSPKRIKEATLNPDRPLRPIGYLEDIDKFDHPLFELSLAEAQVMDPHHRLMLESVYHLFEHAGYSPDDFDGSRTAVFVSDINPEYYRLAEEFPDTMVAGNSPAFAATRISRQFNLTGNAAVIDTACSSSLVAVHMAVSELLLGEADSAIVCGVNLNLQPYRDKQFEFNIWSPDCKSRAFSEDAAGMSCGELVASVLLKPLADAQRDGDTIHAIIKSTAVNNNARRSASPTAPDSISQAGVVRDAWRKAGVDPRQIGYIEAHGSGTKLGDSLEIEGLSAAFRDVTEARGIVPISTIKSSLGHGYNASGIAGLVRAIMALKHRVYFPTLHFERPSSLIDFEQSAVYVNKELREWPQPDGHPRYAGVTSLGASGTNCHVLLQEAPEPTAAALADRSATGPLPFVVSARTPEALQRRLSQLDERLEAMSEQELAAVSWTLARGRKHYRCRFAATADTVAGLREQLRAGLLTLSQEGSASAAGASWRLTLPEQGSDRAKAILLLTDHAPLPESVVAALQTRHPVYRQTYAEVCGSIDSGFNGRMYGSADASNESSADSSADNSADSRSEGVRALAHLIAMYRLLEAWQMPVGQLLPVGIGRLAADAIAGRRTLAEAATAAQTYVSEPLQGLAERVAKLIAAETEGGEVLFVELAPGGELGEALRTSERDERSGSLLGRSLGGSSGSASSSSADSSHEGVSNASPAGSTNRVSGEASGNRRFRVSGLLSAASGDPVAELLCDLYAQGHTPDWRAAYAGGPALRVELPGYPFEPIRCWVRETPQLSMADVMDESGAEQQLEQAGALRDPEATALERRIASYWSEALELDELGRDDHFFELGGDSLLATRVIRRIREELAVKLDFEDLFDYPTLRGFAAYIDSLTGPEDKVAAIFREVLKQPQLGPHDSFFELGGHSLMANQVLLRVRATFGVELNFEEIFGHPTPAELSRYIGDRLAQSPPGDTRTSTGDGVVPHGVLTQTSSLGSTTSSKDAALGGAIALTGSSAAQPRSDAYGKAAHPGNAASGEATQTKPGADSQAAQSGSSAYGGGLCLRCPLAPPQESYPVSAAQKRMWMLSQFPESLIAYNSPFSMVLEGELDEAALAAAFDAVVDRHEVLRTVFGDDQGEPVQLIRDRQSLGIGLELRDARGDGGQAEAEAWMETDRMQPFDLAAGPLIKAVLFAVAPRRHLLYVNMHHIISDGWSSRVLLRDLAALYNARRQGLPDPLPPLRMQYKDYAQWQAQSIEDGSYKAMGAYWRETLGGELPTLELPL